MKHEVTSMYTKKALSDKLKKLMETKPFSKITVSELIAECGLNRKTFYYHFQDIPALLEEIVSEQSAAIIQKYPQPDSLEECFRAAFEFALSNKRAAYNIFNSVNRDLLDRELLRLCDKTVSAYITKSYPESGSSRPNAAVMQRFIKCELFGLIIDWMNNGMNENAITELLRFAEFCKELPSIAGE